MTQPKPYIASTAKLQALLKELGVSSHGTVELAPVVEEHDQWEE